MFGKGWEAAEGTVVATRVASTTGDGMVSIMEFVVDVRTADGEVFRAKVGEPRIATDFKDPVVGAVVRVEVQTKTRSVRFDKDDPTLSWKAYKKSRETAFDATLAQAPGTPAGSLPGTTPGSPTPAGPNAEQIQALLQGAAGQGGVIRLDPADPNTAALREMLLRATGQDGSATPPAAE